eukprot:TRINITY_DN2672_c0_g1_i2.p1 TRINITY_DN2672_c0_g1~~TRINITY_DN2672_c0_g1_i2.p1  ORF type:complete len:442 (-),score=122.92 TRINITY_DN2672_c0_g1_i2:158-1483(-)
MSDKQCPHASAASAATTTTASSTSTTANSSGSSTSSNTSPDRGVCRFGGNVPPPGSGGCSFARNKESVKDNEVFGVYYNEYLQLDKVLTSQAPKSEQPDHPAAHDEMLFIVVHQVYELWFKQILHEIGSVLDLFASDYLEERYLSLAVSRLNRVTEIQRILVEQIRVLETMLPLDFLDFRQFLYPASGFQSIQFRMLENLLGLKSDLRINFQKLDYLKYFKGDHAVQLLEVEQRPSLLELVEKWLERLPFLEVDGWNFWTEYQAAVERNMATDCAAINAMVHIDQAARDSMLAGVDKVRATFDTLFDEKQHNEALARGEKRISHKATKAALMIFLYRDEPVLNLPFRFLTLLTEVDEYLTLWRYRHTVMVHRMLGAKMGTGGSSGYHYLRSTISDRYKVFVDFFNLSTFLIPRPDIPTLPIKVRDHLGFHFHHTATTASKE